MNELRFFQREIDVRTGNICVKEIIPSRVQMATLSIRSRLNPELTYWTCDAIGDLSDVESDVIIKILSRRRINEQRLKDEYNLIKL